MARKKYPIDSPHVKWIQDTAEKARQFIIQEVEAKAPDAKTRFDCIDEVMGYLVTSYIVARTGRSVVEAAKFTGAFQDYLTRSVAEMLVRMDEN